MLAVVPFWVVILQQIKDYFQDWFVHSIKGQACITSRHGVETEPLCSVLTRLESRGTGTSAPLRSKMAHVLPLGLRFGSQAWILLSSE